MVLLEITREQMYLVKCNVKGIFFKHSIGLYLFYFRSTLVYCAFRRYKLETESWGWAMTHRETNEGVLAVLFLLCPCILNP